VKRDNWYVGCACDRAFVQPTAVMLTSLAENGCVPEATILIAAFGLRHEDYGVLLSHAGRLTDKIRFVDVDASMLGGLAGKNWQAHYPPAILGRLFLPTVIEQPGARILTLDSDMIVNRSVRPLFETVLEEGYLAAIHDTPRDDDPDYFNSGLMLIDVDGFKKYDVTRRCLSWLAASSEPPRWPDQDALNTIVGHKWHRLDRTWNMAYCSGDGPLTSDFYEQASVAHFTGQGKPWSSTDHAGRALYARHLRAFQHRRRQYRAARAHVDDNFVATAIEFFLGQEPLDHTQMTQMSAPTSFQALRNIMNSTEFVREVFVPLMSGAALPAERFANLPSVRLKAWAKQRLPLQHASEALIDSSTSWRDLLQIIVTDAAFHERTGITPLITAADALKAHYQGRSDSVSHSRERQTSRNRR
jgi:lipopolysaccharide biosynthesis glycosyltransferase